MGISPSTNLKAATRTAHASHSEHASVTRVNDPRFVLHRAWWDFRFQILSVSRSRHGCASREALVTDTRETENVRFLAGQVHALVGFCVTLINTHPSPAVLSLLLDAVEQITLARVESTLVIEDFLHGVRNVFDRLRTAVASAETRQANQSGASRPVSAQPTRRKTHRRARQRTP